MLSLKNRRQKFASLSLKFNRKPCFTDYFFGLRNVINQKEKEPQFDALTANAESMWHLHFLMERCNAKCSQSLRSTSYV